VATNVIGRGLAGLLKYTKEKAGEDVLKRVLNQLPEEDKAIFTDRIRPTEWYPFRIYANLLAIIDKELGKGDLSICKDIGSWSGERDFKAMYKLYTSDSFKDPTTLKTAPHVMWTSYYDQGDLVFLDIPGSIELAERVTARVIDFPDTLKANCRLLEGWIGKAIEIIGDLKVNVTEVKCRVDGDEYCEFLFTIVRTP
jgi:predicted hydrocarbon binding protein